MSATIALLAWLPSHIYNIWQRRAFTVDDSSRADHDYQNIPELVLKYFMLSSTRLSITLLHQLQSSRAWSQNYHQDTVLRKLLQYPKWPRLPEFQFLQATLLALFGLAFWTFCCFFRICFSPYQFTSHIFTSFSVMIRFVNKLLTTFHKDLVALGPFRFWPEILLVVASIILVFNLTHAGVEDVRMEWIRAVSDRLMQKNCNNLWY